VRARGGPSRAFEFFGLFILPPLLYLYFFQGKMPLPLLWGATYIAWRLLNRQNGYRFSRLFRYHQKITPEMKRILKRYFLIAPFIFVLAYLLVPEHFLQLPLKRPILWLAILILYPLLSVAPQGFLYREFFYQRYKKLFGRDRFVLVAGAVNFGFMHVIFLNRITVLLTLVGGYLLMRTYLKTKSLFYSNFEHALYGLTIFTSGLGVYFYHGRIH
jgi:hypothetical protein